MLQDIAMKIAACGGRAFFVGGWVRDKIMGWPGGRKHDIDIEVFSLEPDQFLSVLSAFGPPKQVGKSYPVYKLEGRPEWDFVLAPAGSDLTGAARRRDFTVNAMMMDVLTGDLADPCGGREDLLQGVIRHTNPEIFKDDPVRLYRAAQLAARLDFLIHPLTLDLMRRSEPGTIPPERIFRELNKLLLMSRHPSRGLSYLEKARVIEKMHPRLFSLRACIQSPLHHPEGDVWEHTLLVVDRAAGLKEKSNHPEALMWAALLHDIGKPQVTRQEGDKITAYGHDEQGVRPALEFLEGLKAGNRLLQAVGPLVREHMRPVLLYKQRDKVGDQAIRKLVARVDVRELLLLAEADYEGRTLERDFKPVREWLLDRISGLGLEPSGGIQPLVRGRDLIAMGLPPGERFNSLLQKAFSLQLEGKSKPEILNILAREATRP